MGDEKRLEEPPTGRLILPSLAISRLTIAPPAVLTGLLLVDIALSFGTSVGVAGQIRTFSALASVVSALLMSVLSIRFKHKSLLLVGLAFLTISAVGCGLAPDFNSLLVSYSLSGLGSAMVVSMTNTLVAEYFPVEKRARAVSLVVASEAMAYAVGAPVIGFIAGFGGWRTTFLVFVFTVSLLGLLLASRGLPSTSRSPQSRTGRKTYSGGFKDIFSNRSAVACLVGATLSVISFQVILLYSASFIRQRFLLPTSLVSLSSMVTALSYTVGSLVAGRFVNKLGRKPLTVLASLLAGLFIMSHMNIPNLWAALIVGYIGCLFAGIRYTAATSLTLEQVPAFRGTMMSLYSAAISIGTALGAGIGGLVLLLYNYELLGASLGAMGVAASVLLYLLAIDPTKTNHKVAKP